MSEIEKTATRSGANNALQFARLLEETRADLLKEELAEARTLVAETSKTFLIYLAVTSILVKFSLENIGTSKVFLFFSVTGAVSSLMFLFVCFTAHIIRAKTRDDLERLNRSLDSPLVHVDVPALKYMMLTAAVFGLLSFVGWVVDHATQ